MREESGTVSKIYFTSDWHVGHYNVLEFDKRPFKDLDHMHQVLVNNYNSTVSQEDVCFFLGDMGLYNSHSLLKIIQELQGTKVLILGNHDKKPAAMQSLGFDVVLYTASLVIAGKVVTLSHCPLRGVFREDVTGMRGAKEGEHWHGESRHQKFSVEDFGQFHLHGHTHKGPEERTVGRQWDVGVRANNYRPVSINQIERWINGEKEAPRKFGERPAPKTLEEQRATIEAFGFGIDNYVVKNGQYRRKH